MPTKTDLLFSEMQLSSGERLQLRGQIERRYSVAYQVQITRLLTTYGAGGSGNLPSGSQASHIRRMVDRDLDSIMSTYEDAAKREIGRVLKVEGVTLDSARAQMQTWQQQRNAGKLDEISRASQSNAAEYAISEFLKNNKLTGGDYIWDATPPILDNSHRECIRRVKEGKVGWDIAQYWRRVHVRCRHKIKQVKGAKTLDPETAWRG